MDEIDEGKSESDNFLMEFYIPDYILIGEGKFQVAMEQLVGCLELSFYKSFSTRFLCHCHRYLLMISSAKWS
ncbi:hypothetical protein C5167_016583 [Papaver somniferum]|nr:hypothetical protein C5167_016583 [Papaver somniferum]